MDKRWIYCGFKHEFICFCSILLLDAVTLLAFSLLLASDCYTKSQEMHVTPKNAFCSISYMKQFSIVHFFSLYFHKNLQSNHRIMELISATLRLCSWSRNKQDVSVNSRTSSLKKILFEPKLISLYNLYVRQSKHTLKVKHSLKVISLH